MVIWLRTYAKSMEPLASFEGVVGLTTCCLAGTITAEVEVTVFLTGAFPVLRPSASFF
jgi:hypothetical protein